MMNRRIYEKVCEFCGKKFLAALPQAKYCSWSCRHHQRPIPSEMVCEFCGKTFAPKVYHAKFCSKLCANRRRHCATLADYEKAQAERKAEREAAYTKRHELGSYGLTEEEMLAVDRAQDGDREQLWRLSQSWTPRQRKYAKDRFIKIHNLFAATWNP